LNVDKKSVEEEARSQMLDPSARLEHHWIKEKRRVESECRVLVLPSMSKGEIVGKYITDSEWQISNRQRMLFIDGKYNNEDGMRTGSL
jgi:hypothetical protein